MPPDFPIEPCLCLNQLQISSAYKNTLEKSVEIIAPPSFKNYTLRHSVEMSLIVAH